jgi:hypothetical protein
MGRISKLFQKHTSLFFDLLTDPVYPAGEADPHILFFFAQQLKQGVSMLRFEPDNLPRSPYVHFGREGFRRLWRASGAADSVRYNNEMGRMVGERLGGVVQPAVNAIVWSAKDLCALTTCAASVFMMYIGFTSAYWVAFHDNNGRTERLIAENLAPGITGLVFFSASISHLFQRIRTLRNGEGYFPDTCLGRGSKRICQVALGYLCCLVATPLDLGMAVVDKAAASCCCLQPALIAIKNTIGHLSVRVHRASTRHFEPLDA